MKSRLFLPAILGSLFLFISCNKEHEDSDCNCIKGKLLIKGICAQYVVQVEPADLFNGNLKSSWIDPIDNQTYTNVFAINNPCNFTEDLNDGDDFYFKLINQNNDNCAVCQAYRPTPDEKNNIKVCSGSDDD